MMTWLKSDAAKVLGLVLSSVAGTVIAIYPPPLVAGIVATVLLSVLTGLGLVSGGTKGAQPSNVVTQPPA